MEQQLPSQLLIGAHTSAQGGVHNALIEGHSIGATTIQLFTANQKTWKTKVFTSSEIALWEKALEETGMRQVMSHDSYLINLGSPRLEVLEKSKISFRAEIERCHALQIAFLNFHPGAALTSPVEECLETIVESLLEFAPLVNDGPTRLLIECTAGQGSTVGYSLEQLGFLISRLHQKLKIGICVDTCHIFAAGYDISTEEGWNKVLKEFDAKVGLEHLYALHVNDSLKPLGSRVDRHACLGEGFIGIECFKAMMKHPSLVHIPKYLETPEGPPMWEKEIQLLRDFAK
ncbi:deoxyribonuclease IV [Rhabdochlamydiaceae symbiont of Dictyostelium giganteum]|uniref:deoxyribonuclease IV n=1 Tax=Rhabdochlamydiaceae symbiont of Dictyostelium giganteum TaxID=3342349 RepID=UPI003850BF4D